MKKLSVILFLCYSTKIFGVDYYISNNGKDTNNGTTINTPWQTLAKLSSVLGGPSGTWGTINKGDRILFRKGDIFRGSIAFSAYNNNRISFDSYGTGATPVIKGSDLLSDWTVHSGNIWKTSLSKKAYFLYINGVSQTLARAPNTGTWNTSGATLTSLSSNTISNSGKNFVNANVCIRENPWRLNRQKVTTQVNNTSKWGNAIGDIPVTNGNFYFDNKLELLDTIGEWYYDVPTQTLYLMSDTNPNLLQIEASTNLLGIAGNDNRSGNIIQNLDFEHYADQSIRLMGAANNNRILNCRFNNNFVSFFVSGSNVIIQNNTLTNSYFDGAILANMGNSTFSNNQINNVGMFFGKHRPDFVGEFYSSGIWLINSNPGCVISENTITNCGNNGIRFGGVGITLEKNYFENILLNMSDGGAIYTYGIDSHDNYVRNNKIKSVIGDENGHSPGGIVNGIYIDRHCPLKCVS